MIAKQLCMAVCVEKGASPALTSPTLLLHISLCSLFPPTENWNKERFYLLLDDDIGRSVVRVCNEINRTKLWPTFLAIPRLVNFPSDRNKEQQNSSGFLFCLNGKQGFLWQNWSKTQQTALFASKNQRRFQQTSPSFRFWKKFKPKAKKAQTSSSFDFVLWLVIEDTLLEVFSENGSNMEEILQSLSARETDSPWKKSQRQGIYLVEDLMWIQVSCRGNYCCHRLQCAFLTPADFVNWIYNSTQEASRKLKALLSPSQDGSCTPSRLVSGMIRRKFVCQKELILDRSIYTSECGKCTNVQEHSSFRVTNWTMNCKSASGQRQSHFRLEISPAEGILLEMIFTQGDLVWWKRQLLQKVPRCLDQWLVFVERFSLMMEISMPRFWTKDAQHIVVILKSSLVYLTAWSLKKGRNRISSHLEKDESTKCQATFSPVRVWGLKTFFLHLQRKENGESPT